MFNMFVVMKNILYLSSTVCFMNINYGVYGDARRFYDIVGSLKSAAEAAFENYMTLNRESHKFLILKEYSNSDNKVNLPFQVNNLLQTLVLKYRVDIEKRRKRKYNFPSYYRFMNMIDKSLIDNKYINKYRSNETLFLFIQRRNLEIIPSVKFLLYKLLQSNGFPVKITTNERPVDETDYSSINSNKINQQNSVSFSTYFPSNNKSTGNMYASYLSNSNASEYNSIGTTKPVFKRFIRHEINPCYSEYVNSSGIYYYYDIIRVFKYIHGYSGWADNATTSVPSTASSKRKYTKIVKYSDVNNVNNFGKANEENPKEYKTHVNFSNYLNMNNNNNNNEETGTSEKSIFNQIIDKQLFNKTNNLPNDKKTKEINDFGFTYTKPKSTSPPYLYMGNSIYPKNSKDIVLKFRERMANGGYTKEKAAVNVHTNINYDAKENYYLNNNYGKNSEFWEKYVKHYVNPMQKVLLEKVEQLYKIFKDKIQSPVDNTSDKDIGGTTTRVETVGNVYADPDWE